MHGLHEESPGSDDRNTSSHGSRSLRAPREDLLPASPRSPWQWSFRTAATSSSVWWLSHGLPLFCGLKSAPAPVCGHCDCTLLVLHALISKSSGEPHLLCQAPSRPSATRGFSHPTPFLLPLNGLKRMFFNRSIVVYNTLLHQRLSICVSHVYANAIATRSLVPICHPAR